jgi:hypothetical protein
VPVQALSAPIGDRPLQLGRIFALEYRPENGWSVARVCQGEALMTLLRKTPQVLAERPHRVEVFQRSLVPADCVAGSRGAARDAADRIIRSISA